MFNKLLSLFGYKLCKLPVHSVSEIVAAFALEMDLPGAYASLPTSRFALCERLRQKLGRLEGAVYRDFDAVVPAAVPVMVRWCAADLALVAMRLSETFGELLPREKKITNRGWLNE